MLSRSLYNGLLFICAGCLVCLVYILNTSRIVSPLDDDTPDHRVMELQRTTTADPARALQLVYNGESTEELTEDMSADVADHKYYRYLFHLHYTCEDYLRLGHVIDGGWDICLVPPYDLKRPCLVYSVGISYDFTFDDIVSKRFGCTVRAFDPSMEKEKDHRRDDNIWFYKIGLGGADTVTSEGWTVKTLRSLINMLNDTGRVIDYMKMDIENNEWAALENMFESGVLSKYVKQFGLEIHTIPNGLTNATIFHSHWRTLQRLEELGFRRWYWHFNHYGTYQFMGRPRSCCYELVYINTKFLSKTQKMQMVQWRRASTPIAH